MTITSLNVVDGTVGRKRLPFLKRRYLIIGIILVIIIVIAIVIGIKLHSSSSTNDALVPPNPTKKLPPSKSTLHIFKKAAVCADGVPCAEIGRNILKKNGSAVDATVAALICNGIVTMQSMGLGGGFLMTIYSKQEGKVYSLNAREKAPMNAKSEMYNDDPLKSQQGPLAIAVPGELRGYWAAHKRFGKLPWKDIIEPSIQMCEKGYQMSHHQYLSLGFNNLSQYDPNIKEWFYDEKGEKKPAGTIIIPTKLCNTLRKIADNGGDDLYNGTLSQLLLKDLQDAGSIITAADLSQYQPEWQEPISVTLKNGDKLFSAPPPGSGILLGFIMNILDGYNLTRESISDTNNTVSTFHKMIEAFKFAYAKRTELGDMNFVNITSLLKNLTSPDYAKEIRERIKEDSIYPSAKDYGAVFYNKDDHGTAHISVLAENGDAVSVTSSVNIYFGAGITSNQTGIIFNSVMDDFSFPNFKNYFGLPGSPNNEMKPGKRPLSSMSPTILVRENGEVKLVLGASGGTKITTAVTQVIMRTIWFGENIKEAVDAPRIHHQVFPDTVEYEYGVLEQILNGLQSLGHKIKRAKIGSIICALMKEGGKIIANADYRKGGEVYGIL